MIIHTHIPHTGGKALLDHLKENHKVLTLNRWDKLDDHIAAGYDCISGNNPYGLHEFISEPCEYITFVRNPIDRLLAYYTYHRQQSTHLGTLLERMSFEQFLTVRFVDNDIVRFFYGYTLPRKTAVTEYHALKVVESLDRFKFIGVWENYNEDVKRLSTVLNWQKVARPIPKHEKTKALPKKIKALADDRCKWDRLVYDTIIETAKQPGNL
jgi:hypothetical protein